MHNQQTVQADIQREFWSALQLGTQSAASQTIEWMLSADITSLEHACRLESACNFAPRDFPWQTNVIHKVQTLSGNLARYAAAAAVTVFNHVAERAIFEDVELIEQHSAIRGAPRHTWVPVPLVPAVLEG